MKLPLKIRTTLLIIILLIVNFIGGISTLWYIIQTNNMYKNLNYINDILITVDQALESFSMQKGYTTYYILSHDKWWLDILNEYRKKFLKNLEKIEKLLPDDYPKEKELLKDIKNRYYQYIQYHKNILALYKKHEKEAKNLHWDLRTKFDFLLKRIENLRTMILNRKDILTQRFQKHQTILTYMVWIAIPFSFLVGLILILILFQRVWYPIKEIIKEEANKKEDEILTLQHRFENLKSNIKESKELLAKSEKMALVGKLGAGVAHSIRNPLTSIKMRLFALEESLDLDLIQKEDFKVIVEEINYIDNIINNFLEFSRPPKLKIQNVDLSEIINGCINLLSYRLKSYNVKICVHCRTPLPILKLDPERIKEAFINIILNSCEAMMDGGEIHIYEERGFIKPYGEVVIVKIKDTGPGIPEEILDKIFEPFFSTKKEGTGLGLSITKQIIEEHGGWIHVQSKLKSGTTFIVGFPLKGGRYG